MSKFDDFFSQKVEKSVKKNMFYGFRWLVSPFTWRENLHFDRPKIYKKKLFLAPFGENGKFREKWQKSKKKKASPWFS
jgi:hypothetical protein